MTARQSHEMGQAPERATRRHVLRKLSEEAQGGTKDDIEPPAQLFDRQHLLVSVRAACQQRDVLVDLPVCSLLAPRDDRHFPQTDTGELLQRQLVLQHVAREEGNAVMCERLLRAQAAREPECQ